MIYFVFFLIHYNWKDEYNFWEQKDKGAGKILQRANATLISSSLGCMNIIKNIHLGSKSNIRKEWISKEKDSKCGHSICKFKDTIQERLCQCFDLLRPPKDLLASFAQSVGQSSSSFIKDLSKLSLWPPAARGCPHCLWQVEEKAALWRSIPLWEDDFFLLLEIQVTSSRLCQSHAVWHRWFPLSRL